MTLRLAMVGHSVLHERQESLSRCLASRDWEVLGCGPARWSDEVYEPYQDASYGRALHAVSGQGIFDIMFPGLGETLDKFSPDIVYIQQEPWSNLALQASGWCEANSVPYVVFSWENRSDMGLGVKDIEKKVLEGAAGVVGGNSMALKRMAARGLPSTTPFLVAPQTGINTQKFLRLPDVPKTFDMVYAGRVCREKGLAFAEAAAKELGLSFLIVGGRGNYEPRFFTERVTWANYAEVPRILNRAKVSVTLPWKYRGWQDQWPAQPGEALATELGVVVTNNGSLPDHYATSPALMVQEANQKDITEAIGKAVESPPDGGREWVLKNHSVEVISMRVEQFIGEVLNAS